MRVTVVVVFVSSCLSALALVGASPAAAHPMHGARAMAITLEEMMKTLKHLAEHPKDVCQLTADVIDVHECKPEDFCRAEKVLSSIDHEDFGVNGKIVRQLREFNKHHNVECAVHEDTEVPLLHVLRKLNDCAQKVYHALP